MDIFDNPEYRLTRIALSLLGQWPFVHPTRRIVTFTLITVISMSQLVAKFCCVITSYMDTDLLFESVAPLVTDVIAVVKITTYAIKMDQVRSLLNEIRVDLAELKMNEEIDLLRRYAQHGKKYSQIYACILYGLLAVFLVLPVAPRLLLRIGNMSEVRPLPHNVEYFVDNEQYYYLILLHSYVASSIFIMGLVAGDTLFITFIQHVCGMLATIDYRLKHLTNVDGLDIDLYPAIKNDKLYQNICQCVERHIRLLSFVNSMKSLYSICFFMQSGLMVLGMSFNGVRAIMTIDNPHMFVRYVGLANGQIMHIWFESVQAQRLIDHSINIRSSLMNVKWYLMSFRTRKIINFMIMISQNPCTMTAGGMFVISMESFLTIIRTAMSYFTVFRNMQ